MFNLFGDNLGYVVVNSYSKRVVPKAKGDWTYRDSQAASAVRNRLLKAKKFRGLKVMTVLQYRRSLPLKPVTFPIRGNTPFWVDPGNNYIYHCPASDLYWMVPAQAA